MVLKQKGWGNFVHLYLRVLKSSSKELNFAPQTIFQFINSVKPNNLSLKYDSVTPSDCKDIENLSV